ncbi:MAG TPA: FtsX-like permease family protein [Polyangiaceae bacterium]|jgi:lipoprotein-releasing system permease protein
MMAPTTRKVPEPFILMQAWDAVGLWGRIAVVVAAFLVVGWLVFRAVRRLKRSGKTGVLWLLLWVLTVACGAGVVGLGFWSSRLPEARGSYFVLWHQVVRVGAALCAMGFTVGFMGLAMPRLLDFFERRGFVQFLAARHVRATKSGSLTVISVLSIVAVALSSLALCSVVSIMGGFGADLKRKILDNNAHVRIERDSIGGFDYWQSLLDRVRLIPGIEAATPVASGEAMASSSSNTAGVIVKGVDTETIGTVINLLGNIEVGKFDYLEHPRTLSRLPADEPIGIGPGGELYLKGPDLTTPSRSKLDPEVELAVVPEDVYPGVVLGRELAKMLHVYVGDELTLVSPLGDLGPMGVMPRSRRFRVAAIFYSGMYEYDSSHAYMKLEAAQEFLDLKHLITAIEMRAENAERVTELRPRLSEAIADRKNLRVRDWKELNKNLFSALQLEKIATFIILSVAIAVASFCIICTLLLMVTEKSKEIAILKAIGASDGAIRRIFMSEGMLIGGTGTVFGIVTGLMAMKGLEYFGVRLDPDVYYVDKLPISVDWLDYTLVAVTALVITTLATVYPAVAASRLRPVDGIRYE